MQIVDLYRYKREDGGITVSPIKPENIEYTLMYRLIADENKELVKDDIRTDCIDIEVDDLNNWHEEAKEEPDTQETEAEENNNITHY